MATMSAAVARRLAEAADGLRTGKDVWFAASEQSLREVFPAPSQAEAQAFADDHPGYEVYGPFNTPGNQLTEPRIASIRLKYSDGSEAEMDAEGVDAIFFSNSACEKFAYPYYARVLGAQAAAALQREGEEALSWLPGNGPGVPTHHPTSKLSPKPCFDPHALKHLETSRWGTVVFR